jgi:hypothetical protein
MTATITDLSIPRPTADWIPLRFTLGGILLFSIRLRGLWFKEFHPLPVPSFDEYVQSFGAILAESQPIEARIPRITLSPERIRYAPSQYRRFHIDLDRPFADYLKKFSGQRRSHLKRVVRNYGKFCGGEAPWREFRLAEEMPEFYRLARAVSRTTYQEKLVDAGLPENEEFLYELVERAGRDAVRGYVLFHNDIPIAYQYCPSEGGVLIYERVGYNPEYASHSPGVILFFLCLEHLFRAGTYIRFDLGKGEYPYKEVFATGFELCADMYYFRGTPTNLLLISTHAALDGIWRAMAQILDWLRLRQRLKKRIRKRYGQ